MSLPQLLPEEADQGRDTTNPTPMGRFRRFVDRQLVSILKQFPRKNGSVYRPQLFHFSQFGALATLDPDRVLRLLFPAPHISIAQIREEFVETTGRLNSRLSLRDGAAVVPQGLSVDEGFISFATIRESRPEEVVETGVHNGVSTFFMLDALRRNGRGHLTSFDVIPNAGGVLDSADRSGWTFVELPQRRNRTEFRRAIAAIPRIDFFLHGSDHSYPQQTFEYRTAFERIHPGGFIASDDVDYSFAFIDFSQANGLRSAYLIGTHNVFGITQRLSGRA